MAKDLDIGIDFHIVESPLIDSPHFKHLNKNSTFLTPEDYPAVDDLIDWIVDQQDQGVKVVNQRDRLLQMKTFLRGHTEPWNCRAGINTLIVRTDGTLAPHLVVPYTLDNNDMRFALPQGFSHGDPFFQYLKDAFDVHYAEGDDHPAMMSIGMHCRLLGRPGRMRALQRFLDHVQAHDQVWVTRRVDIAHHWRQVHAFDPATAFVWE